MQADTGDRSIFIREAARAEAARHTIVGESCDVYHVRSGDRFPGVGIRGVGQRERTRAEFGDATETTKYAAEPQIASARCCGEYTRGGEGDVEIDRLCRRAAVRHVAGEVHRVSRKCE